MYTPTIGTTSFLIAKAMENWWLAFTLMLSHYLAFILLPFSSKSNRKNVNFLKFTKNKFLSKKLSKCFFKEKHKATAFLLFSVYNVFMICYLDIYFLENFIIDFIILICTAKVRHIKIKWKRLIIASVIGAIFSIFIFVLSTKINAKANEKIEIFFSIILKFALSIIMIKIAFLKKHKKILQEKAKAKIILKNIFKSKTKNLISSRKIIEETKTLIVFHLVAFVISGGQIALLFNNSFSVITVKQLVRKLKIDQTNLLRTAIIAGIVGLVIVIYAFKHNKERLKKEDLICDLLIKIGSKTVKLKALLDTGNSLKYKKLNVIVIEKRKLFTDEEFEKLLVKGSDESKKDFNGASSLKLKNYETRLRLIPYKSIGNSNGVLIGIIPDDAILEFNEVMVNDNLFENISEQKNFKNTVKLENVILGIYDKEIGTKYSAIIGLDAVMKGS